MLEEIFAYCLSLFSALTLDASHLSREMNDNECPSEQCIRYTWENRVHTLFDQYISPLQTEYEVRVMLYEVYEIACEPAVPK